jgi:crotonobetainyl-CoA:carnitine CoA-transferase CaiB-like acyl-CoA transferase
MVPLDGVRVVELAHIMAGPVCGLMLADLGAEVIKVEKIPGGDDTRRFLPPAINGVAAAFLVVNRNKKGVALNLKTDGGRQVLSRLIAGADVVIENFRRGTMERLGFGYDDLKSSHPNLIYCAVSGFGRTGPYADRGGFDLIAQGMSGLMSITGEAPGRPPIKVGAPVTDITAGILAALGVTAAYVRRLKTGEGGLVDTSLLEAGVTHSYWQSAICFATGEAASALGSSHPLLAPYQAFPTADGWINVGAANQTNWLRLLDVIEAAELADDPDFRSNEDRMAHLDRLVDTLAPIFKSRPSADWLACMEAAGIPAGPVLDIAQMQSDPQVRARNMVLEVDHPQGGTTKAIGPPIKLSNLGPPSGRGAPRFGQHTKEVLLELEFDDTAIEALLAEGAVAIDQTGS